MKEEWKPVKGYEGLYEVSNMGKVKSLNYNRTGKEGIMEPHVNGYGYLRVKLCKDGKKKWYMINRLVAQAFISNPDNLPEVNHKDEDKTNNCVENLEWCSKLYNANYGTRNKRISEKMTNNSKLSKPVISINKVSGLIVEFPSTREAERMTGINHNNIIKCCQGKAKSAGGHYWFYADDDDNE